MSGPKELNIMPLLHSLHKLLNFETAFFLEPSFVFDKHLQMNEDVYLIHCTPSSVDSLSVVEGKHTTIGSKTSTSTVPLPVQKLVEFHFPAVER